MTKEFIGEPEYITHMNQDDLIPMITLHVIV